MNVLKIFLILVILFIDFKLYSQPANNIFETWLGEWNASYISDGNTKKESLSNSFIHNNAFLKMETQGQPEKKPSVKYSSTLILAGDKTGNIYAWRFDDKGYDGFISMTGKIIGNKVVLNGGNSEYVLYESFELVEGSLYRLSEFKYENKPPVVLEVHYSK